jgi:hypothetical protein
VAGYPHFIKEQSIKQKCPQLKAFSVNFIIFVFNSLTVKRFTMNFNVNVYVCMWVGVCAKIEVEATLCPKIENANEKDV